MTTLDPIIIDQLDGLLTGETNPITVLANASALLNDSMPELNWAGFYLYNGKTGQLCIRDRVSTFIMAKPGSSTSAPSKEKLPACTFNRAKASLEPATSKIA